MATEKDLDLALAAELEKSPEFLSWFVSHTKFAGSGVTFHSCRANHPWGTHPFRYTDETGTEAVVPRQSETDVLLLLKDKNGRIVGVHVENKVGAGKFTHDQVEMYPQRAAHWVGNERYGCYEDFDIVLIAPEMFRERNTRQAAQFPAFISHELIGQHIPLFATSAGVA
ncbi:MAG: hypothetical protein Q7N95_00510 [Alphaproteobacteria bacterium]|nr:hypothetical protein [Alphaproteobacteria bacterium]